MRDHGLRHGPLGPNSTHVCVDMQRLFGPGQPWAVPWLERILPRVAGICAHNPARAVFTRFLPPATPEVARGTWRRYYRKWQEVTLDRIGCEAVELLPELAGVVPPAKVVDKTVYSPWLDPALDGLPGRGRVDTLLVTGGETDVCVLTTALGAIDRGFRVVLVADVLCSSSDRMHDALIHLYTRRFDVQIEVACAGEVLGNWPKD